MQLLKVPLCKLGDEHLISHLAVTASPQGEANKKAARITRTAIFIDYISDFALGAL